MLSKCELISSSLPDHEYRVDEMGYFPLHNNPPQCGQGTNLSKIAKRLCTTHEGEGSMMDLVRGLGQ